MSGSMFNVQRSKLKLKRVDLLNAQTEFFYGMLKWRGNAVMNLNVHDECCSYCSRVSLEEASTALNQR
jgi:hypothetical protein